MALWMIGKSWYYSFQYRRRRYRGSFGPVTKTTAKHLYARVRAQAIEGKGSQPADPLFRVYVQSWLSHYQATRARSARSAANHVKLFLHAFGLKRPSEITPSDIQQFQRAHIEQGKAAATVNRYLAILGRIFTNAGVPNPVKGITRQRVTNTRTRFLSDDEETRLLSACNPRLRSIVLSALHTACRQSELTRLTWGDVDLSCGVLRVRAEHAKSGQMRKVLLSITLRALLQGITPGTPSEPVFISSWKAGYRDLTHPFRKAADRAGLYDVTFHDLRHTFASRLVMLGVHLRVVQELRGHSSIVMTQRYAHLEAEHKHEAVKLLDMKSPQFPRESQLSSVALAKKETYARQSPGHR